MSPSATALVGDLPSLVGPKKTTIPKGKPAVNFADSDEGRETLPILARITAVISFTLLVAVGRLRELLGTSEVHTPKGYAPLVRDFDSFYIRHLYRRSRDAFNRPVDSRPSRIIGVMERSTNDYNKSFHLTGKIIPCINLASYNYLGYADDVPHITADVLEAFDRYGVASCSSIMEVGHTEVLHDLEVKVARFVGKDAAIVCGMGFATNFSGLPSLFDSQTLLLSDNLNHASLVAGSRLSGCKIKVFPHNNCAALEKMIRQAIVDGQPRSRKPWSRIVVMIEGIYSMEGDITNLKSFVELKKKYKILLYVDEAHSIGALGVTGRGVCEHCGVDPADVDVLMGTFTKSYGSIGGYIAGDKALIDVLRRSSGQSIHAESLSPAACQQALSVLGVMLGEDGTEIGRQRIRQLAENSRYFRQGLVRLGLTVFGDDASPVVPVMLYNLAKAPFFSRECLKRNIAVVVVGYPATPLLKCRVRFCVSAAHTRDDLDRALAVIDELASDSMIRYGSGVHYLH